MAGTYPKHAKILELAAKEIGVTEAPMGSNSGLRVRQYQDADWLPGTGYPWCASFACFIAEHAGFKLAYRGAGAYQWFDVGAKSVGRQIPASRPRDVVPGDFVVFRIGQGHIGIVESIVDGAVHSIDGNVSDQVARRIRPLSSVYGFVHLAELMAAPKIPPKPPTYEVVSGENGAIVYYSGGSIQRVLARLRAILKKHPRGVLIRPRPKS